MIKIIGADPVASIAGTDLIFTVFRTGGYLLFLQAVKETGTKHPHGFGLVFQLAALILTGDYQTGGKMGDPYGAVRSIDALAAMTGSMKNIYPKIRRIDRKFNFLHFRKNSNGHG